MQPYTLGPLKVWRHESPTPKARLLLVHGLGEHSGRYLPLIQALGQRHIEVVRFDLRGSGKSDGERMWIESFSDYVEDVSDVAHWIESALPPLPLLLLGHSLGGAIAIAFAAGDDTRLRGLILSAPAYLPGEGVSAVKMAIGKWLCRVLPHQRIPSTLDCGALSRDPAIRTAYAADPLNCTFNTLHQGNEILRALPTMPDLCRRIRVPTLMLHGEADRIIRLDGSRALLEALAAADKRLEIFPGGYHEPHNDLDRAQVFDVVGEWIGAHV